MRGLAQKLPTAAKKFKWKAVLIPVAAVITAFLIGALLIVVAGKSPIAAYRALFRSAFGHRNAWAETLVKMTPLLLAGMGTAVSFRARIFNIGAEGQIFMGALGAASVGLFFGNPPLVIGIPMMVTAGFIAGGLWGGIAGFLKQKFQANEIIITLMLNYVAIEIVSFMVGGPWRDPGSTEPFTARFAEGTILPIILPRTRLHAGIIIALLAAIAVWWLIKHTTYGYRITVIGANPEAARYSGIKTGRLILITMFISGGLAGLAGATEVSGLHHRVLESFSPGYGYTAIAIAMLGRGKPVGVTFASFLFAALVIGTYGMQDFVGVPVSIVYIIEGLVIVFIIASDIFQRRKV